MCGAFCFRFLAQGLGKDAHQLIGGHVAVKGNGHPVAVFAAAVNDARYSPARLRARSWFCR